MRYGLALGLAFDLQFKPTTMELYNVSMVSRPVTNNLEPHLSQRSKLGLYVQFNSHGQFGTGPQLGHL